MCHFVDIFCVSIYGIIQVYQRITLLSFKISLMSQLFPLSYDHQQSLKVDVT